MKKLGWNLGILRNTAGQDLTEYALMAGFVGMLAGAVMPGVASNISAIFSQVGSVMNDSSTTGGDPAQSTNIVSIAASN